MINFMKRIKRVNLISISCNSFFYEIRVSSLKEKTASLNTDKRDLGWFHLVSYNPQYKEYKK